MREDSEIDLSLQTYQQADGDGGWVGEPADSLPVGEADHLAAPLQTSLVVPGAGRAGRPMGDSASVRVAAHLRLRAELMGAVRDLIRRRGLRQREAAVLFGVAQPRVSDLVRGKLALFSIDTLVDMLAAAGVEVDAKLREHRGQRPASRDPTASKSMGKGPRTL